MYPTNDPHLRSWIDVSPESDFSIQNLPYGVFRRGPGEPASVGVAIGEHILNLAYLRERGLFADVAPRRGKFLRVGDPQRLHGPGAAGLAEGPPAN
jgi:hypothetical protein